MAIPSSFTMRSFRDQRISTAGFPDTTQGTVTVWFTRNSWYVRVLPKSGVSDCWTIFTWESFTNVVNSQVNLLRKIWVFRNKKLKKGTYGRHRSGSTSSLCRDHFQTHRYRFQHHLIQHSSRSVYLKTHQFSRLHGDLHQFLHHLSTN